MPTQEGVGGDEKAPPTCPRETSIQRSEDRSIGGPVPDTSMDLTFEVKDTKIPIVSLEPGCAPFVQRR